MIGFKYSESQNYPPKLIVSIACKTGYKFSLRCHVLLYEETRQLEMRNKHEPMAWATQHAKDASRRTYRETQHQNYFHSSAMFTILNSQTLDALQLNDKFPWKLMAMSWETRSVLSRTVVLYGSMVFQQNMVVRIGRIRNAKKAIANDIKVSDLT